ncbi:MAG: acyltransferase [Chthoniobacterales bacterium]
MPVAADPRFISRTRQPGLDLLRAVAILLVVFYHAGLFGFALPHDWQRFGWIGVDLFFVLSGYLIAGQLLTPIRRGERVELARFFGRRSLRILPAYLAVLAVYFFLPAWREFPTIPPAWKFLAFVQNLGLHGGTAFSHAWSLCVEAQFYLALPLVLILLARWKRGGLLLPVAVLLGGLLLRGLIAHYLTIDGAIPFRGFQPLIYYATWSRLDPLVLGVALAAIEGFRPAWWSWFMRAAVWLWLPGLVAIAIGLWLGEGELSLALCLWQFPLIALGMALLLVCAVSPALPFQRIEIPGMAFLASIAYSVYLSHKLAIHAVQIWSGTHGILLTSAPAFAVLLLAIALTGMALFFAVERPFLQLRRRRLPRRAPGFDPGQALPPKVT